MKIISPKLVSVFAFCAVPALASVGCAAPIDAESDVAVDEDADKLVAGADGVVSGEPPAAAESSASVAATTCGVNLRASAVKITASASSKPLPKGTGGKIEPGTYILTSATIMGITDPAEAELAKLLSFKYSRRFSADGTYADRRTSLSPFPENETDVHYRGTYTTSGRTINFDQKCPLPAFPGDFYSYTMDGTHTYTEYFRSSHEGPTAPTGFRFVYKRVLHDPVGGPGTGPTPTPN